MLFKITIFLSDYRANVLHSHVGNTTGSRSYYLKGELAELEQALIRLALTRLLSRVRLGGVNYLL